MSRYWVRLGIVMAFLAGLAACGQKGPLYLPDNDTPDDTQQESSENPAS